MIKKYKDFKKINESIKDLLIGPTDYEVLENLKKLQPIDILEKSIEIEFLKGVKYVIEETNFDIKNYNNTPLLHSLHILSNDASDEYFYNYNFEISKYLLENGINSNNNMIMRFVRKCRIDNIKDLSIIELLIIYSEDNINYSYCMYYAEILKNYKLIELLKKYIKNNYEIYKPRYYDIINKKKD